MKQPSWRLDPFRCCSFLAGEPYGLKCWLRGGRGELSAQKAFQFEAVSLLEQHQLICIYYDYSSQFTSARSFVPHFCTTLPELFYSPFWVSENYLGLSSVFLHNHSESYVTWCSFSSYSVPLPLTWILRRWKSLLSLGSQPQTHAPSILTSLESFSLCVFRIQQALLCKVNGTIFYFIVLIFLLLHYHIFLHSFVFKCCFFHTFWSYCFPSSNSFHSIPSALPNQLSNSMFPLLPISFKK